MKALKHGALIAGVMVAASTLGACSSFPALNTGNSETQFENFEDELGALDVPVFDPQEHPNASVPRPIGVPAVFPGDTNSPGG